MTTMIDFTTKFMKQKKRTHMKPMAPWLQPLGVNIFHSLAISQWFTYLRPLTVRVNHLGATTILVLSHVRYCSQWSLQVHHGFLSGCIQSWPSRSATEPNWHPLPAWRPNGLASPNMSRRISRNPCGCMVLARGSFRNHSFHLAGDQPTNQCRNRGKIV